MLASDFEPPRHLQLLGLWGLIHGNELKISSFAPSSSWQLEELIEFISIDVTVLLCRRPLALLPTHEGHSSSPQQTHRRGSVQDGGFVA